MPDWISVIVAGTVAVFTGLSAFYGARIALEREISELKKELALVKMELQYLARDIDKTKRGDNGG